MTRLFSSPGWKLAICIVAVLAIAAVPALAQNSSSAQGKIDRLEQMVQDLTGIAADDLGAPDLPRRKLGMALQATREARQLATEARETRNAELASDVVELLASASEAVSQIVASLATPGDPELLQIALEQADVAAETVLILAELARETEDTELALAALTAAENTGAILYHLMAAAQESGNIELAAGAMKADETLANGVYAIVLRGKRGKNTQIAAEATDITGRQIEVVKSAFQLAESAQSTALAGSTVGVAHIYSQILLALAEVARDIDSLELGQIVVNQAAELEIAVLQFQSSAQYLVATGDDPDTVSQAEVILARLQKADATLKSAVIIAMATGAVPPNMPQQFPPEWWKEPPLDDTRFAIPLDEDEEEPPPVSPI